MANECRCFASNECKEIKYQILNGYENYCVTSEGKVYKLKNPIDEGVAAVTPANADMNDIIIDAKELKYVNDVNKKAIMIYLKTIGGNGKKKTVRRKLNIIIGNALHEYSQQPENKGKFIQYVHIDGDYTNNKLENLKPKRIVAPPKYHQKGYTYYDNRKKYLVRKVKYGKRVFVGLFDTEEQAKQAYENA